MLLYLPGLFLLLARVGSSFLWRCQLSLPRPPMVDWRFSGVESTAIASRLFLDQMVIRGGFRSDPVCFVSRAAPMLCSYMAQQFTISSNRSSNVSFKRSTCVLCPPICQSKFPDSKAWPSNFDISDTSDLPLTIAFEKLQLAMKTLHRVSCHGLFCSACVGTCACMSCTLDLQLAPLSRALPSHAALAAKLLPRFLRFDVK